jgi:GMC oxidoreductase
MMEADGGARSSMCARNGRRQSVFRSYVFPLMDRPNLTVLTGTLVLRLTSSGRRVTGVQISYEGKTLRLTAGIEVVLSLGAINTPKVLMQSGIGDQAELRRCGISVVQHLPGVGQNFQDHVAFDCVWEYREKLPPCNTMAEATFFWKSASGIEAPDIQVCQAEVPKTSRENAVRFGVPENGWTLFGGLIRPKSRGCLRLTGPDPDDPIRIESSFLSHPDDFKTAIACVDLCREVGNSAPLQELDRFVRDAAVIYWHDGNLKVYGIQNLRIADGIYPSLYNFGKHHRSLCSDRRTGRRDLTKRAWVAKPVRLSEKRRIFLGMTGCCHPQRREGCRSQGISRQIGGQVTGGTLGQLPRRDETGSRLVLVLERRRWPCPAGTSRSPRPWPTAWSRLGAVARWPWPPFQPGPNPAAAVGHSRVTHQRGYVPTP